MRLSNRNPQRGTTIELSMTSMIDVVFLLLIFFMTTASFVKTERHLDPNIVAQNAASRSSRDLEPVIVEVVRNEAGQFVYQLGSREIASFEELTVLLQQFSNKMDGAFVRVGDDAPFGMGAAAIEACKMAGFVSVSYMPLDQE